MQCFQDSELILVTLPNFFQKHSLTRPTLEDYDGIHHLLHSASQAFGIKSHHKISRLRYRGIWYKKDASRRLFLAGKSLEVV